MELLQAKLLKEIIGVHKWSRNSPVLKALNIKKIETTIDISSCIWGGQFYAMAIVPDRFTYFFMNTHACGKLNGHTDLVSRIRKTCDNLFLTKIPPVIYSGGSRGPGALGPAIPWGPLQRCDPTFSS